MWLALLVWMGCSGGSDKASPPDGCDPAEYPECVAGVLAECVGGDEVETPCEYGCNLDGDACNACDPGEVRCKDTFLVTCQADGKSENQSLCDLGCNEGRLECNECTPDSTTCVGDDLVTCGADGREANAQTCPYGCSDPDSIGPLPGVCADDCDDATDCDDNNPCTRDECVPMGITNAKACQWTNDDTLIPDDNVPCTIDTCSAGVEDHSPGVCDDSVPCTTDTCDPLDVRADADGCLFTETNSFCDDTFDCNGAEVCDPSDSTADSEGCVQGSGQPDFCDDSVGCTNDTCIGAGGDADGCSNVKDDNNCSNGWVCTLLDSCAPEPRVDAVSPDNGLASVGADGVTLTGVDFGGTATVSIGGVDITSSCTLSGIPTTIVCDVPPGTAGTADVVVTNDNGLAGVLSDGFTYTTVATDANFCTIQWPRSPTTGVGDTDHFGQLYVAGLTDASNTPAAGVLAEFGVSELDASGVDIDPLQSASWMWLSATPTATYDFSTNNDEYTYTFTASAVGVLRYAWRFSLDGGLSWNYCDEDDANSGFDPAKVGVWTVQ